jgi:hypothetical protein
MAKSVSPDKGKTITWYIEEKLIDWQKDKATELHNLVLELIPEAKHGVKWAQAVYESPEGPLVYMKGSKNHISFGFWRGGELDDAVGLLEGSGDKMKHVKIKSADSVDRETMSKYILQAAKLNAEKGDPTKG